MTPSPTDSQHGPPLAIDYAVVGPRTAAAVAAGKTRLVGMSYAPSGESPHFVSDDLADVIRSFGDRPRLYFGSEVKPTRKYAVDLLATAPQEPKIAPGERYARRVRPDARPKKSTATAKKVVSASSPAASLVPLTMIVAHMHSTGQPDRLHDMMTGIGRRMHQAFDSVDDGLGPPTKTEFTVCEVSKLTGLTKQRIRSLIYRGEIQANYYTGVGNSCFVPREDVRKLMPDAQGEGDQPESTRTPTPNLDNNNKI